MLRINVELGTPANRNLRALGVPTPHFWKLHITSQMLRITFVMDRGYIDFQRLFVFTLTSAFFVVRTKSNVLLQRRYSHPVDKSTGVRSDQTVILSSFESASVYPDPLRRVSYFDAETGKLIADPRTPLPDASCCNHSTTEFWRRTTVAGRGYTVPRQA